MTRFRHATGRELRAKGLDVPWFRAGRAGLRRLLGRPSCRVLVAEEEGAPVAILGVTLHDVGFSGEARAVVFELDVDPCCRQSGVDARILRYAEGIARVNGCRRMEVEADLVEEWSEEGWPGYDYHRGEAGLCKWLEASRRRRCA